MGRRSFAGYVCEESLSVGLFGETFRGRSKNGEEARVVVVESRLSGRKNFAVALARSAGDVAELMHPHIVTTEKVGRGKDGSLVIIASAVDNAVELSAIFERAGGRLAQDVALSIGMGALRALSHAHEHHITHGGVHPRSVIVDGKGVSRLGDFGLAYALASAAAKTGDSELLAGLRGFVAPELGLGQEPDQTSDVYAGAALISQLVWGQSTPPADDAVELASVLRQALSTDRMHRFSNAGELEAAVRSAIATQNLDVAPAARVRGYIQGLGGPSEAKLDEQTEDLLASLDLGGSGNETNRAPTPAGLDAALAGLDEGFLGLEDSYDDADAAGITVAETEPMDPLAGFADDADDEEEPTAVDDVPDIPIVDPLEEMLMQTPSPHPAMTTAPSSKRRTTSPVADDYDDRDDTPLPPPRPFHQDHTHAVDLVELVGRQAKTSAPFLDSDSLPDAPPRSNSLRWLALIAFVLAVLFAVAYTKTDFLKGAKSENEARATEALEKIERMQPKPGQITLLSDSEDAAVWLLVGRTPAMSFPLPSSMVHELRVEHEGYLPVFLSVGAAHWSGEDKGRKATLSASLVAAGDTKAASLPAFPPLADPPVAPGGPGQGVIKVDSVPEGAEVWLLVGTTPEMTLTGIEAGQDYEFKVLKDGHRPAFAAFKAESWYLSGSEGPMRPILSETVALEPLGEGPGSEGAPANVDGGSGDGEAKSGSSDRRNRSDRRKRRRKRKKR